MLSKQDALIQMIMGKKVTRIGYCKDTYLMWDGKHFRKNISNSSSSYIANIPDYPCDGWLPFVEPEKEVEEKYKFPEDFECYLDIDNEFRFFTKDSKFDFKGHNLKKVSVRFFGGSDG